MVDEKDMGLETKWYMEGLAQKAIQALKKNGFDAEYAPDRKDALAKVIEKIPRNATIGCADSVTLHQIGLIEWFKRTKDHEVFDPFSIQCSDFGGDWPTFRSERFKLQQKALIANVFVSGTNAITLDGKLVNIDGHGNRVAGMIFGPNKIIIVSGANKIVNNVEEALKRIHEYAAPINNRRHVDKHGFFPLENQPCVKTGRCTYCHTPNMNCRITTIIDGWAPPYHCQVEYQPTIIILGESLGI